MHKFAALIAGVALLACGCATTPPPQEAAPETHLASHRFDSMDYSKMRAADATEVVPGATARLDMTLLDVDRALALEVLGLPETHKFEPVSRREPVGEIMAVRLLESDQGEILARPTKWVKDTPYKLDLQQTHYYLGNWEYGDKTATPIIQTWRDGVVGSVSLTQTPDGGQAVSVDTTSAQTIYPLGVFWTGSTAATVRVQIPEVVAIRRVAVESLRPGETAAFFLSQAAYEDTTRLRMLFVRLTDTLK